MRVFLTTTVAETETIFRDGFTDVHGEGPDSAGKVHLGFWVFSEPLDVNDGWPGPVTVCLDVPEDVFAKYEWKDPLHRYREALIPAAVLNGLGKPQVYDHDYAGTSRKEILNSIRFWEAQDDGRSHQHAKEMRNAMEFFDRIGWLTPLRVREEVGGLPP